MSAGQADRRAGESLLARAELHAYAARLLGSRGWWFVSIYGRVMSGPHSGSYVSGLPLVEAREVVNALAKGTQVPVHLMHRHRSGCYESSDLRLVNGQLVMVFADREELA